MSEVYQSLSHSKWDCKYHVIFVPKRCRKVLYGELRQQLKGIFHELARQKECQILEGHLMPDHVHMVIAIPPKYAVSAVIGFLKGKSAIAVACLQGKSTTSPASICGLAVTRCRPSDLSWTMCSATCASKTTLTRPAASEPSRCQLSFDIPVS